MNACSIPLDDYLKCLNDNGEMDNRCKNILTVYNNCVLGKGKWKEHHEKYEKNNLLNNLNAEKKRCLNDNGDKKIFPGEKFILNDISRYND
jgi:hypothetical protein